MQLLRVQSQNQFTEEDIMNMRIEDWHSNPFVGLVGW